MLLFLVLSATLSVFINSYKPVSSQINLPIKNHTTYSEFSGKGINFQYPSNWTISSPKELSVGNIIRLYGNNGVPLVLVTYFPLDKNELDKMKIDNMTQREVENRLEYSFPTIENGIISQIKQGTLTELEKPSYDKFLVDGHRAGSVYYNANYSEVPLRFVLVGTVIGSNAFTFDFGSPVMYFNDTLPIAEKMIKSVKFVS